MAYKPVEIIQLAGDAGKYKANLSVPNFLVRGFMAGLFIAVGAAIIIGMMIIPMSPLVLDVLLTVNITAAMTITVNAVR